MKSESNLSGETNQFINTSKTVTYEDRENMSVSEDSVLSICPQCNYSTSSIQLLDSHMEQEHGENNNYMQSDDNSKHIKSQITIVKQENIDECGVLEMKSEFYTNSVTDSQSRDGGSPLSSTSNKQVRQISDSRRRYRCNICPVTFPWHGDLAAHLSEVHGFQKSSRDGAKTRAGSYKCSYCMYVAKYQSELKRHRRLHMGVKPFGCVFCKYRSAWKGDLKRHIESHHRGHFNSEEELASIMSQYKNNAGTDIKEINEDVASDSLTTQGSNTVNKDHVNDIISMVIDKTKSDEQITKTFICEICNFSSTKQQLLSDHQLTCHGISLNHASFDEKKNHDQHTGQQEIGLNLTTNNNLIDIQNCPVNFSVLNSFPQIITSNNHQLFQSTSSIGDSVLKATPEITSLPDISIQQPIPGFIQGMKNEFLSVMGSQNNFSFNDFVSRIFGNINGILPPPPPMLTNTLSHPQFIGTPLKSDNFLHTTSIMSPSNVLNLNSTASANINLINSQNASAFHSTVKDVVIPNGEFEFPIPTKPSIFDMEKSFKNVNGMFATSKLTNNEIMKFKENNSGLINTHQEHWKRFKCSACGHRSNWKWDINKHIKVAHPERDGITTLELSYEDAKATLQSYLNSTKANKARSHNSFESEEGYYRPYKCSSCGHRSNWKWDVNKHIKQVHQRQAEVITLSMEEAKSTICQYKRRRRTAGLGPIGGNISSSVTNTLTCSTFLDNKSGVNSPTENNSSMDNSSEKEKSENTSTISQITSPTTSTLQSQNPRIDTLRLKRLKCDGCGYRSNYRSDISRHIRRKHDNLASVVFLSDVVLLDYANNDEQQNDNLKQAENVDNENEQSSQISNGVNEQINSQQRKLWQCNLCQFSHREKIQVSHHITKNHHPERPFNCKLCQYGTDYRNSLLRHVKAKHKVTSINGVMDQNLRKVKAQSNLAEKCEKSYQQDNVPNSNSTVCLKCGELFTSYQELFQHTAINHATSDEDMYLILKLKSTGENNTAILIKYSCPHCPYLTTNPDAAQIHQFQHSEICEYPFRCTHCSYKASHNKFLINHLSGHIGSDQLNILNYSNEEPEDLSCPKTIFKYAETFNGNENRRIKSNKMSKHLSYRQRCHKCLFRSTHRFHLRLHYQRNHREKNRKFVDCREWKPNSNFSFNDRTLSIYKNIDFQSNLFWCDECGYLTNEESQLKLHLMKHINNNNNNDHFDFKCSLCIFSTKSDKELKNHELMHVLSEVSGFNDRASEIHSSLKCDMCNFVTNIEEKLDFHKNFHYSSSDLARFSCPKCNFKHYQLYCFIKHLKYHH